MNAQDRNRTCTVLLPLGPQPSGESLARSPDVSNRIKNASQLRAVAKRSMRRLKPETCCGRFSVLERCAIAVEFDKFTT